MAARKSCTHLTWAEAKNQSGIGTSSSNKTKNKGALRKQDQSQVLALKIISKHGGDRNEAENRKLEKAYRKQAGKVAALSAKREEEREQKRLESMQEVQRYKQAQEKLAKLMQQLPDVDNDDTNISPKTDCFTWEDDQELQMSLIISQCKRAQMEEVLALEAMILPEDFILSNYAQRARLEEWLEQLDQVGDVAVENKKLDESTRRLLSSVSGHPPISYFIKLEIEESRDDVGYGLVDLNVLLLVHVTLPPLYLKNSDNDQNHSSEEEDESNSSMVSPVWELEYVMVTDKSEWCSAEKPLESLAWVSDPAKIQQDLAQQALLLAPYPCVYEVTVTWLSEHIWDYLNWRPIHYRNNPNGNSTTSASP